MKNLNRTVRVYCYDEKDFGWPNEFTTKLNMQVRDSRPRLRTTTENLTMR